MTYRTYIQCSECVHFYPAPFQWHCDAFPDKIPEDILNGSFDHKKPHEGDHGIQFEKKIEDLGFNQPSEQTPVSKITMKRIMTNLVRYYIHKPTKKIVKFDGRYSWYDGKKWVFDPSLFKEHWIKGRLKEITQEEALKAVK